MFYAMNIVLSHEHVMLSISTIVLCHEPVMLSVCTIVLCHEPVMLYDQYYFWLFII
jgi:hypothetical protein